MLLSDNTDILDATRYRATQSRSPMPWYEHTEVGYNYRLSNVLAALGRAQLRRLDDMIARRRSIREYYESRLGDLANVRVLGQPKEQRTTDNGWLTCLILGPKPDTLSAASLIEKLDADGIEARHLWKPLHMQPIFAEYRSFLTGTAESLFKHGLCLPSGAGLTDAEIEYVAERVLTHVQSMAWSNPS